MQSLVDWGRIDTVLLDMDGTLLDLYFDNHFWLQHLPAAYGRERGLSHEAAHAELVERFGREQGRLNWYCVDFWTAELGLDVAGLKKDIVHLIQPRPGALDFLREVRASGREAWLVTNAHHHSLSLKLAHTPLTELCDRIVCSHDFREPKESAAFWPAFRAREPFEPARALFVDDSESVLGAAAAYGVGQLLTIGQPDSRKPVREGLRFPVLHHFDDLRPIPPRHVPA